ncbi:hypothetical protein LCGC14_0358240 [marine sediment metagenome]|uniref:Uncharacterized protein n=1 Tax=marine sediment metagenome TaxID=412755 RepID=A0A0F9WH19_9ZZZZ
MGVDDQTITITTELDQRIDPLLPVWEHLITASYDTDDTSVATQAININGILLKVVISVPVTTATGTTSQVLIKDNNDVTIFDSGELAESATPYTFNLFEALSGSIDVSYEPSGAAGSAETPTITLRGI